MKILCFIDVLGGGGAQRQMVTLAASMVEAGHQVEVLTYHPHDFFSDYLKQHNVSCRTIASAPFLRRMYLLARVLRGFDGDAVLAFLERPSLYAELFGLPRRRWRLVVSERAALSDLRKLSLRLFHHAADCVTTNSHDAQKALLARYPSLEGKVHCIYNVVDFEQFKPGRDQRCDGQRPLRLVSIANYSGIKNVPGVIRALIQSRQSGADVELDWFGANTGDAACLEARAAVISSGMQQAIRLHGPTGDAASQYQQADALILGSFTEGLPNVVCEAMSCGLPVLMSDIADARHLVEPGVNGFLFDPHQPEEIAAQITAFAGLSRSQRLAMGRTSLLKAEKLFDRRRNTGLYLELLQGSARGPERGTW